MYDYPGAEENGKHDWVEIFNDSSSSVSLSEWRLRENDTDHQMNSYPDSASGMLAAGGYAVVANDAVAFKVDFPSYTGLLFDSSFSLVSSGETLVTRCCGSNVADRTNRDSVSYTPIDSASDQGNTLQRTSSAGVTFISASPTPGTGSLSSSGGGGGGESGATDTTITTTTDQSVDAENSSSESTIMPPPPKVFADGGSDRTVVVGADTEFRARAYNEKKDLIGFSRFHWNFGDGSTSENSIVFHRFDYPGRYVVVLDIPEEKDSVSDQIVVTVEPMKLALSLLLDGGVAVENRSGRTLDFSRWIIRSAGQAFTIPDRTFVLANATLRVSQRTLGFSGSPDIELDYPNGDLALGLAPPPAPISAPPETAAPAPVPLPTYGSQTAVSEEDAESTLEPLDIVSPVPTTTLQVAAAAGAATGSSRMWWLGAFGIAGLAAGSLVVARRYGKKEWDIEEMEETR
ncbi:hypothetical protein A3D71_00560 [Candidatus Kaiserbacteria bacterium RIFCSPHIGHO2_02_FULL_55_20]|uniref:PKD domain-containing protein n=1 Tax=Candidatus Kaiserbacteria bacterium RIFCSPHIGHO2_02_FULL_55_20 TaxID=1798497 RepID=A0A1F6DYX0_9BACT|nr:MAG: hypothetical protein A2680_01575 [Candidatus Kaiserbacteria bacterium RIFCSPHIGHO2_01_FULL_55_37]OGG66527.1 MAG: hypothetical protein A3D71_00560 [Candidatus Kaiserbacteria bacterium RIFCSPHIGHO2_02_FULL_55_20]